MTRRPSEGEYLRGAALLTIVALLGCPRASADVGKLPKWAGCRDVRLAPSSRQPLCYLKPGDELTFFFAGVREVNEPTIRQGTRRLEVQTRASLPQGLRLTVVVPTVDRRIEVVGPRSTTPFILQLRLFEPPAPLDFERVKVTLKTQADLQRAEAALRPYLNSENPVHRAKAISVKARLRYRMGSTQTGTVTAMLRRSIAMHRALNLVADEHRDRFMALYQRVFMEHRVDEIPTWLGPLRALHSVYPLGEAETELFRSNALLNTGSVYQALRWAERAQQSLDALGRPTARDAANNRMRMLRVLGRHAELAALLKATDPASLLALPGCTGLAPLLNFAAFGPEPAARAHLPDIAPEAFRDAADDGVRMMKDRCPQTPLANQVYLSKAVAHLLTGHVASGISALDEAPLLDQQPTVNLTANRLRALAYRLQGQYEDALKLYKQLEKDARRFDIPEEQRQAVLGQAHTLRALERNDEALEVLRRAEALLEEQLQALPLGVGRESFIKTHESIAALHVSLLLAHRNPNEAYDAVVRGHRRGLAALARIRNVDRLTPAAQKVRLDLLRAYQSNRVELQMWLAAHPEPWTLSAPKYVEHERQLRRFADARRDILQRAVQLFDAYAPSVDRTPAKPAPGEVILAFHPLSERRWAAFLMSAEATVQVATVKPDAPSPTLGPVTLNALVGRLDISANTKRLRVLDSAALQNASLRRVVYRGQPMGARWPIIFTLDVVPGASRRTAQRAVVVRVDPFRTLKFADIEADHVARRLQAAGYDVVRLGGVGQPPASFERVVEALSDPQVALMHFVGHGDRQGNDGWNSGIVLHRESRLTAADVLMLESVPPIVVLSACSTGEAGQGSVSAGLGLAQAFTLVGARWVFGTTGIVDDQATSKFARALYSSDWPQRRDPDERLPDLAALGAGYSVWQAVGPTGK